MKDVWKMVRFLQCFTCGEYGFNVLNGVALSAIANAARNVYFPLRLYGKKNYVPH